MPLHGIGLAPAPSGTAALQLGFGGYLEDTVASIVQFLPRLLGAIVILLVGWAIGLVVAKLVRRVADGAHLDRYVRDTPLGRTLRGSQSDAPVASLLASVGKWFTVALAVLAAADLLAIPVLSEWIQTAVAYLPAFVAGLLVIVFGFIVADFVGDMIQHTRAATETAYTSWFAAGTRVFLYFTAITIGLATMGIDVSILFVFARAAAWGLAAAMAIGVGIAVGWGGHTYVAENIGRWMGRASSSTPKPKGAAQADGGQQADDD